MEPPINITVYTDGSCHTQLCTGAWVAIVLINNEKIIRTGTATDTTHHRMEVTAVIEALQYIRQHATAPAAIKVITDSQFVAGLTGRRERLTGMGFQNKKGNTLRNADLIQEFLVLEAAMRPEIIKIKAHQQANAVTEYNIEADRLCRQLVRDMVGAGRLAGK